MSLVDDRKRALENKFAHDQLLKFRATARRNGNLARWAATLLGKDEGSYAHEVMESTVKNPSDEYLFDLLRTDLDVGGIPVDDETIRRKMAELQAEALDQLAN